MSFMAKTAIRAHPAVSIRSPEFLKTIGRDWRPAAERSCYGEDAIETTDHGILYLFYEKHMLYTLENGRSYT